MIDQEDTSEVAEFQENRGFDAGRAEDAGFHMPGVFGDEEDRLLARAGTLRGDLRDRILDRIQGLRKPWGKLGQFEQEQIIAGVDRLARTLVRDALLLVAGQDRTTIEATLDSLTVKDGISAILKLPRSSAGRNDLVAAVKKDVLIVVLDTDEFGGESASAEAEPDQPDLPLAEDEIAAGEDSVGEGVKPDLLD